MSTFKNENICHLYSIWPDDAPGAEEAGVWSGHIRGQSV